MSDSVLLIDMSPSRGTPCVICEAETEVRWGLAVYEDLLVPDDHEGAWGGAAACERCFGAWKNGTLKAWWTFSQALRVIQETERCASCRWHEDVCSACAAPIRSGEITGRTGRLVFCAVCCLERSQLLAFVAKRGHAMFMKRLTTADDPWREWLK